MHKAYHNYVSDLRALRELSLKEANIGPLYGINMEISAAEKRFARPKRTLNRNEPGQGNESHFLVPRYRS